MALDHVMEMAYPRKMVEQIVMGLSNPLNRHLVRLVGFDFSAETRQHFRREMKSWLSEIQTLRLRPNSRTASSKFYFDLLFDYPFGGVEVKNMKTIMDFIMDEYDQVQPVKRPDEMVQWLRQFHTELAERLHNGEAVLDMIPE